MLEDLLKLKRISQEEYDMYALFTGNELGNRYLKRMVDDTFMDQVPPPAMTAELLAYAEGRRSIFRDIKFTIERITTLLEGTNDGSN